MAIVATRDKQTARQVKTLAILLFILLLVVLSPTLRLGTGALRSRQVRLGSVELTVPSGWMLSDASGRMAISKPCYTIFCRTARAGFIIEISKSADSEKVRSAAKKTFERLLPDTPLTTINDGSGQMECIEADSTSMDGKVMASCLNSNLHLTSTFKGEPSSKPVFYEVLHAARNAD